MNIELRDSESEALVRKLMSSGAYSSAEEVVQRALAALDAEEAWNQLEREDLERKIRIGMEQLDRGEGISGDEARLRLQARKAAWLAQKPPNP